MPKLLRPAQRAHRTYAYDGARWEGYAPRDDDIIITTYPKCGTTWMQRLVGMLIFQSPKPQPLSEVSPWIDRRAGPPIDQLLASLAAQTRRRFIKSHLPLDALPLYDTVKYIHVARDGRDACLSFHNHSSTYTQAVLANMDRIGISDPAIGYPYPRAVEFKPFYLDWIEGKPWGKTSHPLSPLSFFEFEASFWSERRRDNLLLVHFDDLLADLDGEMRRIAAFLDIEIPEHLWPKLIAAGSFDAMRRDGDVLMPEAQRAWQDGARTFLHKGVNGRWRDLLTDADIALYEARAKAELPAACAHWLANGRHIAGDPRAAA